MVCRLNSIPACDSRRGDAALIRILAGRCRRGDRGAGQAGEVLVAAMSPAQVNDGILFFLYLLVLLLAMMIYAVIRFPAPTLGSQDREDQQWEDAPAAAPPPTMHRAPARPVPGSAGRLSPGTAGSSTSALAFLGAATGRSGRTKYVARHVAGPEPGRATIRIPKVSGRPPWGPAPRPPGQHP